MRYIALIVLALALAACGSSPASSPSGSPSAGSPSAAAAGSPSAVAPSPLPSGEESAICSDVAAEVIAGDADPAGGAESVYHVSAAQVLQAVNAKCPNLAQDVSG